MSLLHGAYIIYKVRPESAEGASNLYRWARLPV